MKLVFRRGEHGRNVSFLLVVRHLHTNRKKFDAGTKDQRYMLS